MPGLVGAADAPRRRDDGDSGVGLNQPSNRVLQGVPLSAGRDTGVVQCHQRVISGFDALAYSIHHAVEPVSLLHQRPRELQSAGRAAEQRIALNVDRDVLAREEAARLGPQLQ